MTTTVGQQLAPYVEESTSTKEQLAEPCDALKVEFTRNKYGHTPHDTLQHEEYPAFGYCLNEATHTGVCPMGDDSFNMCEDCMNGIIQRRLNPTMVTINRAQCGHFDLRDWNWFKK